jgi:hypothetical protein
MGEKGSLLVDHATGCGMSRCANTTRPLIKESENAKAGIRLSTFARLDIAPPVLFSSVEWKSKHVISFIVECARLTVKSREMIPFSCWTLPDNSESETKLPVVEIAGADLLVTLTIHEILLM